MNRKTFTLVEVLVVVGIISILAGLVIPAVGLARQAGRRTECVSNQGQLMKLLTITMQANDNYLVSGDGGSATSSPLWTGYLLEKNKLQNLKGYRCPSLLTSEDPNLISSSTAAQLKAALGVVASTADTANKGKNGFDFRGTKSLKDSGNILSPVQLVLGGCSGEVSSDTLVPSAHIFSDKSAGNFYLVHGDEFNTFFLDGHVESVTKEKMKSGSRYIPNKSGAGAIKLDDGYVKNFED